MKHLNSILVAAFLFLIVGVANAQDKQHPWAVEIGINAVDVYPVGITDNGRFNAIGPNGLDQKGKLFDEYFNQNDHWSILPSVSKVSIGRYLGDNFTFAAVGTINKIDKIGDERVDDWMYYGVDGEIKYSMRKLFGNKWFDPTIGVGGGYTWIDDIGFGTANALASIRFWLTHNFGVNFQSTYKHAFEEDYGVIHFQHSVGVTFQFGCTDTDGDGICDNEDECPEVAGLLEFNGCPDTDGDGIEDRNDACPDTPGIAECNGCPDTDGDGICDPQDACPTVPGIPEMNGCPDTDGDGITDAEDECPTVPGPKANNGCPWPDRDGDGVLDKDDQCPDVPGTVANHGCPEVSIEVLNQLNEYSKVILFDYNKATIRQESHKTLDAILAIMREYPNTRFELEGHTDSDGRAEYNQTLSENRAKSVHDYLVEHGMDDDRLSYIGYGETRPIATNKTKAGKQQNRRVEISLIKD